MLLSEARSKALEVLAPQGPGDPNVLEVADSLEPPCIVVTWSNPWLTPDGLAPQFNARLEVRCVAGRYEPEPGFDAIEALVDYAVGRLANDDSWAWVPVSVTAPRSVEYSGIRYLVSSAYFSVPVDVGVGAVALSPGG